MEKDEINVNMVNVTEPSEPKEFKIKLKSRGGGRYSEQVKRAAVAANDAGVLSQKEIVKKYKLRSDSILKYWVAADKKDDARAKLMADDTKILRRQLNFYIEVYRELYTLAYDKGYGEEVGDAILKVIGNYERVAGSKEA